jgi:membrane protein DedA with SNARE-associated domain
MSDALGLLAGLPGWAVYLLLAGGAAVENLIPPIPADTFVVVAGLLSERGVVDPVWAGVLTWAANVVGALLVYRMGYRHGRGFFEVGAGRWVLRKGQLRRIERFYSRWGTHAVFFARFLPGLRAVVPAFAGISHQGFWRTALPMASASAIWYGGLIWVGRVAGRNLPAVESWFGSANRLLLGIAVSLGALLVVAWWKTRHDADEPNNTDEPGG